MGLNEKFFKSAAAADADPYFNTVLYPGTGSGSKTVTGVGFQPDLVWGKAKNAIHPHILFDSVRGENKQLSSNNDSAEVTRASAAYEFEIDGFTVTTAGNLNNAYNYVAWCWKAAGFANAFNVLENGTVTTSSSAATAGITAGSITTGWNVSANRDAGFSIVKYTGNETANQTVGHGLSQTPEIVFIKQLDGTREWTVPTLIFATGNYLVLNDINALADDNNRWSAISSSTITIGTSPFTNASPSPFISYFFHSVAGVQKVGSYDGIDGTDVKVYTDSNGDGTGTGAFEPMFVMIKYYNNPDGSWAMFDSLRDGGNPTYNVLFANSSAAESTYSNIYGVQFDSDGFTVKGYVGGNDQINETGGSYIYLAIA